MAKEKLPCNIALKLVKKGIFSKKSVEKLIRGGRVKNGKWCRRRLKSI